MQSGLTVAFDADDTLWHNEHAFAEVEALFDELVAPWASAEAARAALERHERQRIRTYGYGVKGFALAMISTACELSNFDIDARTLHRFVEAADDLLAMATVPIDGAIGALAAVSDQYPTLIITKGDLHHQLRRVDEADVARFCFDVEVVAEKDSATYRRLLARHRIDPANFVMVGNSVVSDIAPVLAIGGSAIHIPYETTWALETAAEDPAPSNRWHRCDSIAEVPELIRGFAERVAPE